VVKLKVNVSPPRPAEIRDSAGESKTGLRAVYRATCLKAAGSSRHHVFARESGTPADGHGRRLPTLSLEPARRRPSVALLSTSLLCYLFQLCAVYVRSDFDNDRSASDRCNYPERERFADMRPRVAGMNEVDDSILEFFASQDESLVLSPALVWYNLHDQLNLIDKSHETVARRMRKLSKRGLLEKVDDGKGYYSLTQKGRDYLVGDVEADDLRIENE
jgi:hypothetical protein